MAKTSQSSSARQPPEPGSRGDIDTWISRVMPELSPTVKRLDEMIRAAHDDLQYAVKWRKAYYGLPERGWIVELVAYDVSVNVIFHGGADFDSPPPLGENGRSRYVKVRSEAEADTSAMRGWIEQAGRTTGWQSRE